MEKKIIFKSNLKPYLSIVWQKRPVWKFYSQLKNHLVRNLGEEFAALFAEPIISDTAADGLSDASWLSDLMSKQATKLSALSGKEQEKYEAILSYKVQRLEQYAKQLADGNDPKEKEWGELIIKCLEIPSYDAVLVEGNQVVLVLWGFRAAAVSETFSLTRKIASLPINLNKVEGKDPILMEEPELLAQEPIQNLDKENLLDKVESSDNSETTAAKEPITTENIIPENPKKSFWQKWRWLFLLLGLLLLCLLGLKYCRNTGAVLPKEPNVILPIDSTKIEIDKDSTSKIVSDRLNVAIGAKEKTVQAFALKFKELYPSSNYTIIYYDTTTSRLQIQIPASERENLKLALKQKLPDFKLLIWEEAIFESNAKPSDPGFDVAMQCWYHERVKVYGAWDITKGDKDIVIAVIDDGFDLNHTELSNKVYMPRNMMDPKSSVSKGITGHGTHVAGIALALSDNGTGVSGLAPNCKFMPIQVGDKMGRMSSTAIIDAVLYAIHNDADVINMSLGKMMLPQTAMLSEAKQEEIVANLYKDEEAFWNQLFKMAYDEGVTVVLAGGNQNIIIGLDPMQRTPYTINVSAIDMDNKKASFSNYGQRSTLSAPGVQIYSTFPNGKFELQDGTSMAAPVVAGAVALMKSINPAISNADIVDILQTTGIPIAGKPYVGNLIQLGNALPIIDKIRQKMPKVDCPESQKRIDELLKEIDRIREECRSDAGNDTLKMPIIGSKDFEFAKGRWKSTTPIFSQSNSEKVTIYFDFYSNGKGLISLVEPNNTTCTADLDLKLEPSRFLINQLDLASCAPAAGSYNPYTFECVPDYKGCAVCTGKNKTNASNQIVFNLIRVKSYH